MMAHCTLSVVPPKIARVSENRLIIGEDLLFSPSLWLLGDPLPP